MIYIIYILYILRVRLGGGGSVLTVVVFDPKFVRIFMHLRRKKKYCLMLDAIYQVCIRASIPPRYGTGANILSR